MAARSLIQLFRNVNPDLLHKKDKVHFILFDVNCNCIITEQYLHTSQGKPTEAMPDRPLEYGEVRPAVFIPGTEVSWVWHLLMSALVKCLTNFVAPQYEQK